MRIVHDGHDDQPRVSIGFIEPCEVFRDHGIRAVGHSILSKISGEHPSCDHLQGRACPPRAPPCPPIPCALPPSNSHYATEWPCQSAFPDSPSELPNCSRRVCVPASVSISNVFGFAHVTCSRPGTRIIAAAPYGLHCSPAARSLSGSHASATRRPSALSAGVPYLRSFTEAGNSSS